MSALMVVVEARAQVVWGVGVTPLDAQVDARASIEGKAQGVQQSVGALSFAALPAGVPLDGCGAELFKYCVGVVCE